MQHVKGVVSALTCLLVDETGLVELELLNAEEELKVSTAGGDGIIPILYYIIGIHRYLAILQTVYLHK